MTARLGNKGLTNQTARRSGKIKRNTRKHTHQQKRLGERQVRKEEMEWPSY